MPEPLSEEQINHIVTLYNSGHKWPEIEKETGIPQKIAKREYDRWKRIESLRETGSIG